MEDLILKPSQFTLFGGVVCLLSLVGCGGSTSMSLSSPVQGAAQTSLIIPDSSVEQPGDIGVRVHTNHLILKPSSDGMSPMATTPYGLSPAAIRGAYKLPATGGSNAIAIVDAYDYPSSLNDFNVFSGQYGLPKETSTNPTASTNKVFQVVYANGTKPAVDVSWAQESALDTQLAHAMAPGAKIYLVEAASSSYNDIMAAVLKAKTLPGVKEVSMSFGGGEASILFSLFDNYFVQPGVVFFASGGDTGGARLFPAESVNVVAVGGTSLRVNASGVRTSAETAWNGTGCGPSAYEARPAFQAGVAATVGTKRGSCDIAAVADPATGVSVYDSTPAGGLSGWLAFGGTSVSAPLVAGIANLSGTFRASSQAQNQTFYAALGSAKLTDITAGSAGPFAAKAGYDLPTGVGTPLGTAAF